MVEDNFLQLAINAKKASKKLATLSTALKNKALLAIAEALGNNLEAIFEANKKDLSEAKIMLDNGEISQSLYNRLKQMKIKCEI